jgi:hypothetical protein
MDIRRRFMMKVMLTGTAVYGTVCAVVWEDGGGDPASYPISDCYAASALTILFKRLLCLAALFLLTMPLLTIESMTGTAAL